MANNGSTRCEPMNSNEVSLISTQNLKVIGGGTLQELLASRKTV